MTKGRGICERSDKKGNKIEGGHDLIQNKKKMKKNMQRLGGKKGGLSLESFAKAKTRDDNYNPALIKKQREFYRNAKYVSKYKRSIKQQEQQNVPSIAGNPSESEETNTKEVGYVNRQNYKSKKSARSLEELYKKKHDEEEKARLEREAIAKARKEEIRLSQARRKSIKENMYKKTKSGQPVMKYRIEHLLDMIQKDSSN